MGQPVPDTVARLRCTRLAVVPAHLLEVKNRESPQEPELLTGGGSAVVRKRQSAACSPDLCNKALASGTYRGRAVPLTNPLSLDEPPIVLDTHVPFSMALILLFSESTTKILPRRELEIEVGNEYFDLIE